MSFKNNKIVKNFLLYLFLTTFLVWPFFLVKAQGITLNPPIPGCSQSNAFVNLNWSGGSPPYYIQRKISGGSFVEIASTSNSFYSDTSVESGKSYTYRIRSGTNFSNEQTVSTLYCPPVLQPPTTECQADGPRLNLSWSPVSGDLSVYEIYRDGVKIASTTNTNFVDGPNIEGTKTYNYFIKAIWQNGNSTTSQTVQIKAPACPPSLIASADCLTINPGGPKVELKWTNLLGVQNYQVYRKAQAQTNFSLLAIVSLNSYTDNLVESLPTYGDGGTISYYVKAVWEEAVTDSDIKQITIPRCSPYLSITTNCEEFSFRLSWTATLGVSHYNLYRNGEFLCQTGSSCRDEFGNIIPATSTFYADYLDLDICPNQICTFTYYVEAVVPGIPNIPSNSVTKDIDCATPLPPSPPPQLEPLESYCLQTIWGLRPCIKLNWSVSENVRYYTVWRNGEAIASLYETSFSDCGVQSGYNYSYYIEAVGRGASSFSNLQSATAVDCSSPSTPVLTLSTACEGGWPFVQLNWTETSNTLNYEIWEGTSTNLYLKETVDKTILSRKYTDLLPTQPYYYKIVAKGPPGVPPTNSAIKAITTPSCWPTTPNLYQLSGFCESGFPRIRLDWSTDGANTDHFEVFRRKADESSPVLVAPNLPPSTRDWVDNDPLLQQNTTYYYKVEAVGYLSSQRASSGEKSVTSPDCVPPGPFTLNEPSIFCQDGYPRATLSWTTSTNSTSYDLYRYLINPDGSIGGTTVIYSVTSPYTDFGLGKALNFDGSNDYVNIPNSSYLQITGDLTISFWAYPTNISKGRQNPLGKAYGGEFDLTMETSGRLSYYHGSAGGNTSPYMNCYADNIFSNNRMVHVTIIRNVASKTVTIYKNGIAQTTYCSGWVDPSPSNRDLRIGYEYAGYWQGWLDEIRIYNRSLNQNEVSDLFNGVDIRDGLRGLWHFDEGSPSQFVSDSSNYLNNGILGSTAGSDRNDPSWVENGLQWNKTYMWQVRANGPGGSTLSNTTTPTTLPLCSPTKPGLRLVSFCDETTHLPAVTVRWSFSTNATLYEIYRQDKNLIATTTQSINPAQRVFVDNNGGTGLSENTSYTYWVKAVNGIGPTESDHLTVITPVCLLPTTPQNVTATFECSGSNPRVKISWSDSDYADSYRIYRDDGWVSDSIADTDNPTYTFYDTFVRTNTTYIYRVKAFGPGGESEFSDPATTTTGFCQPSQPSIKFLTTDCQSGSPFNQIYWSDPDVELNQKFFDGFETGDFYFWSDTNITSGYGQVGVELTNPYHGSYSAKARIQYLSNWTNAYVYKKLPTRYDLIYARAYIYLDDFSSNTYLSAFLTPTGWGRTVAQLGLDSARHLRVGYFHNGSYYSTTSAIVLNLDTWYHLEIKVKVDADSTGDGEIRVYLNGSEVPDLTLTGLIHDGYCTIDGVAVGFIGGYRTSGTIFVDSVIVSTNYIGPGIPIYNANQYKIYRNTSGSAPTESDLIKTINSNDPEFLSRSWKDETGLENQKTYYYWIKSVGPAGQSLLSSPSSIKTYFCGTPSPPTLTLDQLYCENNLPYARLSWNSISEAYSYNLYRINPDNSLSTYSTRLSPLTDRGSFALKFDGSDDYGKVEKNDDTLNKFGAGLTVEVWGKQTSYTSQRDSWLLDKDYTGYRIWGTDRLRFGIRTPTQGWIAIGDTQPVLNQWYHLVGVVDNIGLKMYLYINGQLNATYNLPEKYNFDYSSNLLTFGKHSGSSYYWPGEIAEIRIYGRVLSPAEIQEHYQGIYKNETELRGVWHFDEGRGVTIYDSSGNSNHGSIAGPEWVIGKSGKALEFGGMNGYISLPNSLSLDITNLPLSIFAWIKGSSTAVDTGWIVAKNYSSASDVQYGMFWRPGEKRIQVYLNGGNRVQTPNNSVLPDQWYFVGFTWDGQYVRAYINGTPSATGTYSGTLTSRPYLRIGRRESASYPFKGIIDEVRIYNRALTPGEISNLFNGIEISDSGLVGLWHFDEGSGNIAYDDSPFKNDGTLIKGAEWVIPSDLPSNVFITSLESGKNYRYYAKASGVGVESPASNEISVSAPFCLPEKPILNATSSCEGGIPHVKLSWQLDPNTAYWTLYKKKIDETGYQVLGPFYPPQTSFPDLNVQTGATYEYFLRAIGYDSDLSTTSDLVSLQVQFCAPPPYDGDPSLMQVSATSVCYGYSSRIRISWAEDPTTHTMSYNIWRKNITDGETEFSPIPEGCNLPATARSFLDYFNIVEGKTYQYQVEAVGSGEGNTLFSFPTEEITALNCSELPPNPPNLVFDSYNSKADEPIIVFLHWQDVGNAEYYKVWRDGVDITYYPGEETDKIPGKEDVSQVIAWADMGMVIPVVDGVTYTYQLTAHNKNTEPEKPGVPPTKSNEITIYVPPALPGNFTLQGERADTTFRLKWTVAKTTPNGGPVTYQLLRSSSANFDTFAILYSTTTPVDFPLDSILEFVDTNPTPFERFYKVRAINNRFLYDGGYTESNSVETSLPLPKWKEIAPY